MRFGAHPGSQHRGATGSRDPLRSAAADATLGDVVTIVDADPRLEQLAAVQHGVVSRAQALEVGMSPAQLRARVQRQRLRWVAPGVLGFPGHADSHLRRCWVAVLHAGDLVALSHRTAALLHGMAPIEGEPVELIVERGRSRGLPGTTRHRPRGFDLSEVVRVDGLPVTGGPRRAGPG
jgi:hypothetical protein